MKKSLKIIFLLILFFPLYVPASMSNTYSSSVDYANGYISKHPDYNLYIVGKKSGFDIPFKYSGGILSVDSIFNNGGFLNLYEFNISKDNIGDTYLYDGLSYWTMTESSNNIYIINSSNENKYSLKDKTESDRNRITEYIIERTKVTGEGTYTAPWEFIKPEFDINLTLVNANISGKTTISEKINSYNREYTINADKSYYKYTGDITCTGSYGKIEINGTTLSMSEIYSDVSCTIKYTPDNMIATFIVQNGTVSNSSLAIAAESTGGVTITPNAGHAYDSASCTNGQVFSYANKEFKINNIVSNTTCTIVFKNPGRTFSYSAANQTYTVDYTGYYTLEGYGAQGTAGGYGGYASGRIYLTKGQILTINTGGQNGYNGGGSGYYVGGGPSTIKLNSTILLSAAGGGGGTSGTAGGNGSGAGGITSGGTGTNGGPGTAGTNGGGGGSGYNYTYNTNCSSCYYGSNTCSGGYVNYNCSSCYYGSNTCSGAYVNTTCNTYYSCSLCSCASYTSSIQNYNFGTGYNYYICNNKAWSPNGYTNNVTCGSDTKIYSCGSSPSGTCTNGSTYTVTCSGYCQGTVWTCSSYNRCSSCGCQIYNQYYDSCYYGSNTCSYGCSTYYDSCYYGSNTCSYGCDTATSPYNSGQGGMNIFGTGVTNVSTIVGAKSGNGQVTINFYGESGI